MSLESVIAAGGVTSVAIQIADRLTLDEAHDYALNRWPDLSFVEAYTLATMAYSAYLAGQSLAGGNLSQPQQLDIVPEIPGMADDAFGSNREQIAVEITIPEAVGGTGKPYLIIITGTGTESISELIRIATDELCRRAKDSPKGFPDVDCTNVLVFDYEILSAIRSF